MTRNKWNPHYALGLLAALACPATAQEDNVALYELVSVTSDAVTY